MKMWYEIVNANSKEKQFIQKSIEFIQKNYSDKIHVEELRKVEITDSLPNSSSGKAYYDKIILSRKNGLEALEHIGKIDIDKIIEGEDRVLFSTIYHELWHVCTWKKYFSLYESALKDGEENPYKAAASVFWLEYIAHKETVFMEVKEIMRQFCIDFSNQNWEEQDGGYSYFIKALPYYIVRSQYMGLFEELTEKISCKELKEAVYKFALLSRELYEQTEKSDIEKRDCIEEQIVKLFEE